MGEKREGEGRRGVIKKVLRADVAPTVSPSFILALDQSFVG